MTKKIWDELYEEACLSLEEAGNHVRLAKLYLGEAIIANKIGKYDLVDIYLARVDHHRQEAKRLDDIAQNYIKALKHL